MFTNSKPEGFRKLNITRKGFTLIELLAVIVILAIIALVAVPIILNMINNARKSAVVDAAYGYIEAVEYNMGLSDIGTIEDFNLPDGTYKVSQINNLKIKGKKPIKGTVTVSIRKVSSASLCIDNYLVSYNGKEASVTGRCEAGKVTITFKNGNETVDTRTLNAGVALGELPSAPEVSGKIFEGWYTATTGGTEINSATLADEDQEEYYTRYRDPESVTVTFINGETTVDSKSLTELTELGSNIPADQTPEEGYTFDGWYTASTGGSKISSATTVPIGGATYYARFKSQIALGTEVYFDPVSTNSCTSSTFSVSAITGGTSTCYKWRVIGKDENAGTLTVQMDHNLINNDRWSTGELSSSGPDKILTDLANATTSWTRVDPLDGYTYDTTKDENNTAVTRNYGVMTCNNGICTKQGTSTVIAGTSSVPVRARLITGEEVKAISVAAGSSPSWTLASGQSAYFYLSSGTTSQGNTTQVNKVKWMVENTDANSSSGATANAYGDTNLGYWTLSPVSDYSNYAWDVYRNGRLGASSLGSSTSDYGARPVITLLESEFSS